MTAWASSDPIHLLVEDDARRAAGLDVLDRALDYAGVLVEARFVADVASLTQSRDNGMTYVITGEGRNRYAVAVFYTDARPDADPLYLDDDLNLAEVVRVMTDARGLPQYPAPTDKPTNARKRWLRRTR